MRAFPCCIKRKPSFRKLHFVRFDIMVMMTMMIMRMMITMMTWRGAAPSTRTVSSTYNFITEILQRKYRPSACKRGPRIFVSCARSLQVSSYQQKQNPSRPVKKKVVFASGGGLRAPPPPPPNPPAFFVSRAGLLSRTPHLQQELRQTNHTGILFANEALRLPPPQSFYKLCKIASSIILPAKTEHKNTSGPVIKTLCLQVGVLPPNPPRCFLNREGLLSRTSHHQQDLRRAHSCYRTRQNS